MQATSVKARTITRPIFKGDEYLFPPHLLAKILLHVTQYQPGVTCTNFNKPFPKKPWFLHVCSTSLLKTLWEMEKLLIMNTFSFSQCFQPFRRSFCHFHQIQNCCLQKSFSLEESKLCHFGIG